MDQQELRKIEDRCIQEQPPWCTAACPLHVDVRGFIGQVRQGKWDQAWKVLRRTMPLPGILGRICDAPCRESCKRSQAGESIEIGALERVCVAQPPPRQRIMPLPAKDQTVAVVGAGLAGLTVAWDLSRKGYQVHIFEPGAHLGASLPKRHPEDLTQDIVTRELAVFEQLGVAVDLEQPLGQAGFIKKCRAQYDAVFLSLEEVDPEDWGLETQTDARLVLESPLQKTSLPGVFAVGQSESPVRQAAEGRWAATSLDRFLQNVSLTAGREREKPFQTKLYTSLAGVEPLLAVPFSGPRGSYTPQEAIAEAIRCLDCQCLECVKVCPYLEEFKGYPKKYAREIYNNESIVMGVHQANKLANSCSLCGLCEAVCPQDFAMQDLCLQARRVMVRQGKMPPSAHEFALLDMEFSQSESFFLARHEPRTDKSAFVFFPGCQLPATRAEQTALVYGHLRAQLAGGVGLMLGCCGAPAHWSGREELFSSELKRLQRSWQELGEPRVIAACSTCYLMLKDHLPEIDAVSLWPVLYEAGLPEVRFTPTEMVAIHDPCTSRGRPEVQEAVRRILKRAGAPWQELELGQDKTECCGFGGLMQNANPALARETVTRRAAQSKADYLAYCAMCRDSLAGTGKRVFHLLDMFFPCGLSDPAAEPRIGWSQRQENRARLKERLLKELWREGIGAMQEHQKISLIISPETERILDGRRILIEDIQKVIHHAETTGDRLLNQETGRYKASYQPYKAVFWVEYTPQDDAYQIHNAYAHRMEVVGGGRL